eukprot:scaffold8148_cov241-Isochrysis_galbana.AAC.3
MREDRPDKFLGEQLLHCPARERAVAPAGGEEAGGVARAGGHASVRISEGLAWVWRQVPGGGGSQGSHELSVALEFLRDDRWDFVEEHEVGKLLLDLALGPLLFLGLAAAAAARLGRRLHVLLRGHDCAVGVPKGERWQRGPERTASGSLPAGEELADPSSPQNGGGAQQRLQPCAAARPECTTNCARSQPPEPE